MYKVFVNEKKLSFSKSPTNIEKNLPFEGITTIEIALDLLENTSCPQLNIYGDDLDEIWNRFTSFLKVIKAAGGIVSNKEGKILFIYRLGKWDLPKGKIEPEESLESAALREVEEETSLTDLVLEEFINSTFHIYAEKRNGKEERILKITYWFKMTYVGEKQPAPQEEEGISKTEWKTLNEIKDEILPNTFKNIQLILESLKE